MERFLNSTRDLFFVILLVLAMETFAQESTELESKTPSNENSKLESLGSDKRYEAQKIGRDIINFTRWKKFAVADKKFRELEEISNDSDEYYYLRASLSYTKKDFNWAEADLKKALKINETHEPSLYLLGTIYVLWGDWLKAKESYKLAIQLSPYNPFYHMNLGLVYYVLGEYENAKDSATKAIRLKENFTEAKILSIQADRILGRKEIAFKFAEKLYNEDPKNQEIKYILSELYSEVTNDFQRVIQLLERERNLPISTRRALAISYYRLWNLQKSEMHSKEIVDSGLATEEDRLRLLSLYVELEKLDKVNELSHDISRIDRESSRSVREATEYILKEGLARKLLFYYFPFR